MTDLLREIRRVTANPQDYSITEVRYARLLGEHHNALRDLLEVADELHEQRFDYICDHEDGCTCDFEAKCSAARHFARTALENANK